MQQIHSEQKNPEHDQHQTDILVGERVRGLRKARGLSLKEVAAAAGLSTSFLSQIERGLSSASVRALARIADALQVMISDIFPTDEGFEGNGSVVARVKDRKRIELAQTGVTKELLTPFRHLPRLDIYMMTLEPGGRSSDQPYAHDGEEAGIVIEGGLELIVDGRKYVLGEGDTFRFKSSRPHQFSNAGDRVTRALWVNFRPE